MTQVIGQCSTLKPVFTVKWVDNGARIFTVRAKCHVCYGSLLSWCIQRHHDVAAKQFDLAYVLAVGKCVAPASVVVVVIVVVGMIDGPTAKYGVEILIYQLVMGRDSSIKEYAIDACGYILFFLLPDQVSSSSGSLVTPRRWPWSLR